MTLAAAQTCAECHFGLSVDHDGAPVCWNRHCPAFDQPVVHDTQPDELAEEADGDDRRL